LHGAFPAYNYQVRILLVANGYPPTAYGGVETYTHSLAQTLHAAAHDVRVFCRESDQNRPDREIITDEVAGISVTRVVNDFKNISTFRDTYVDDGIRTIFLDQLQADRPDIIHYQHWIALSADLPRAAEDLAVPGLATLHDYWALCHRVHLQDWRRTGEEDGVLVPGREATVIAAWSARQDHELGCVNSCAGENERLLGGSGSECDVRFFVMHRA
jgi:glycosyltransferase involved in cell wall biosynthesis